jgi:hypothetical protein
MIAKAIGTETVWEQSPQLEHHPLFGDRETGRSSARQVERFLVHPNVIKSLPTGRAVVITKVPEARVRLVQVSRPVVPTRPTAHGLARVDRTVASATPSHARMRSSSADREHPRGPARQLPSPRRDGPQLQ